MGDPFGQEKARHLTTAPSPCSTSLLAPRNSVDFSATYVKTIKVYVGFFLLRSMSDHHANVEVKVGSERSFGVVFAVVFFIIGLWPLWSGNGGVRPILLGIGCVFLGLGIFFPQALRIPNRLWFKFGMLLGSIVAPIVMALVFFTTFVPFGLVMRLAGKDLLSLKMEPEADSYWITRDEQPGNMKNQF